jgi:MFS family permease
MMKKGFFTYENKFLTLMSLTFGLVFLDRFALVYLSPFIAKDLNLNNTQIGILVAALSLTWAISGYILTAWAEANNKKKVIFLASTVLFSLCSITSGLATGFFVLLLSRLLMGFFEGPTLPLIQSFIAKESSPNRIALNMGILQSFGSTLFGFILAPVLLVVLAEKMGWRSVFFIVGIPGLIMALINWKMIKASTAENTIHITESISKTLTVKELWQYKNIRIATFISCCLLSWLNCCLTFMPQFLVKIQGLTEGNMGKTMGMMGVSSFVSGLLVSALADRFGRKPITHIFMAIGVFFPLAVIFLQNMPVQIPLMLLTWFMFGTFPVVLSAVPSESVPRHSVGKAIGLITGAGEIIGGVLAPFISGVLADTFGLQMPFWVASVAAIIALILSFSLIETKRPFSSGETA